MADAAVARDGRPDRTRPRPRSRRRQGRPSGDRDAQLPRVDRRLRCDHLDRGDRRAAQCLVGHRRDRLRPRRRLRQGGARRRATPDPDRSRRTWRDHRPGRRRTNLRGCRQAGDTAGGPAARRHDDAAGRDRPRRRHDDPVHVRNDRPPEGRYLDPPCRAQRADELRRPSRRQCRPRSRNVGRFRRRSTSDGIHVVRAVVPRDGVDPGHARIVRQRRQTGDDAPLGPRPRPRADRAGAGDQLRRCSHDELGSARGAHVLAARHIESAIRRRWGCPDAARAGAADRRELLEWPPGTRIRHDRDQRLRPPEFQATTSSATPRRPVARCRSWISGSPTRSATCCPRAKPERSGFAARC